MARVTGLEPATSSVTGGRSNQLSYTRTFPCPFSKLRGMSARLGGSSFGVKHTMGISSLIGLQSGYIFNSNPSIEKSRIFLEEK